VVGVNEYYTSKRCPVCEDFVGQVDLRRFYCSKCKVFMHRDVMAGHNMANAVRGHLLTQQRPRYLQPRDVNRNYPWEETPGSMTSKVLPQSSSAIKVFCGSQDVKRASVKRKASGNWTEDQVKRRIEE